MSKVKQYLILKEDDPQPTTAWACPDKESIAIGDNFELLINDDLDVTVKVDGRTMTMPLYIACDIITAFKILEHSKGTRECTDEIYEKV
jgi:hypothetical protein